MLRRFLLASALGTALLASAALAQSTSRPEGSKPAARTDVSPQARAAMHVNALALADPKQCVPDEEARARLLLRLFMLARQEAIGAGCEGYVLDQQRMFTMMFRTTLPLLDGRTPRDVRTANFNQALRQDPIRLGSELAQFSFDPRAYCDHASKLFENLSGLEAETILVLKRS